MKKFLSFLTVMVLIVSMIVPFPIDLPFDFALPASAATSGTTGDCTWTLENGVLTISGIGAMKDYGYGYNDYYFAAPWGTSITEVIIQDGVTSIGELAFYNCRGLTSVTIPDSVTSIGWSAFYDCTSLTSVTIGNGVTSIEGSAFYDCKNLTSITIPNSVTSIWNDVFYNCTGLTSVYITDFAAWCNITFDGYSANPLYYAKKLYLNNELVTDLTIPDGVTSIGKYAFYNCTGLTSITIPDGVTSIGKYAFYNCTGLTSITIPDGVTSIGKSAFYNCTGLTSITIPDSVTSIGSSVFYNTGYYDNADNWDNDVLYIGKYLIAVKETFSGDFTLKEGTLAIGGGAFSRCTGLISITIPDSVTSIGEYAFEDCAGLTSITIPDSVTSIGEYAFEDCAGLTSITIPDSVTSIGSYAFGGCTGLTGVYITDMAAWCNIDFGNSSSNPLYYAKKLYLNGNLVTKLGIPRGVTEIKNYVFYSCDNITSVTIPDSVTGIGSYAFKDCAGLTSITIPDSVTSIGSSAFYGCTGLTSITIPNSVTSIGKYAFYNCTGLTSITIPDSVTSIGENAFRGCTGLTSITIPDSVTSIGEYAFYGCYYLRSITIPYSVNTIGSGAFDTRYDSGTDATLMVHEDSAGHTYALNNGNPYELTEHTPAGEDVIVPATCTVDGSKTNKCNVCTQEYTRVLPMIEHELEETALVPATCSVAGSKTEHCSSCGQDFVTVLPQLAHQIEDGFCTLCGCPDIQSEHPYGDNLDQTWTHTIEGVEAIDITFSEETYVEENIDYITIYDGEGNEINYYTGAELAGQTVTIPGDTVKIRLESDSSGNGYGFSVTAITAKDPEEPEIPTYNGIELSTATAIRLLKHIDGHDVGLTDEQADISGDGKVSIFDAIRFLQLLNSAASA